MKKFTALVLAFSMLLGCCISASAANYEDPIEAEIQRRFELEMESVYAQLEQQNALELLDVYEAIIYPMIKNTAYAEQGIMPVSGDASFYAPNGGIVDFMQPREAGFSDSPVVITCLTNEQSAQTIMDLSTGDFLGFSLASLSATLIGETPKLTTIVTKGPFAVSLLLWTVSFLNDWQLKGIENADNFAMIIETYWHIDSNVSVGISGWTSYPYIWLPDRVTTADATFQSFPRKGTRP